jgi:hypothetical protein
MKTPFHLEAFSKGMKAKLDVKYRRNEDRKSETNESKDVFSPSNHERTLPFTKKTRGYGTYVRRGKS